MTPLEFFAAHMSLKDIPQAGRTPQLCEAAIKRDGMELQYVPLYLRTVRLTKLAAGNAPRAYGFAPAGVREDYELALFALRRGGLQVWDKIPQTIIDYDLCKAGVKGDGNLIKVIPSRFIDYELCRLAVMNGGADPKHIPSHFLSDAAFWNGVSISQIPDSFKTYDICLAGVRKCGNYLQYVPDDHRDVIVCKAALANTPWAYRFVPERHHHTDFLQEAYRTARAAGAQIVIPTLERKIA